MSVIEGVALNVFLKNACEAIDKRPNVLDWRSDPKGWTKTYNMRSSAQCAFSAIKRRLGHRLASIRKNLQRKEHMTKVLAYNLNILAKINQRQNLGSKKT